MKILVVDDHALIREALRAVLKKMKRDATVLEASNCTEAMQLVENASDLELILLDLNLPDREGFSALAELRQRYPAIPVVVVSAAHDREKVRQALALGALGFIPKKTEREVMLNALRLVFSGGIYIPPEILADRNTSLAQEFARRANESPIYQLLADRGLTGRQIEVVALMMQGKSNKAISRSLNMSEATVKNHVTVILKSVKAANRTEAVVKIGKMGWPQSSD